MIKVLRDDELHSRSILKGEKKMYDKDEDEEEEEDEEGKERKRKEVHVGPQSTSKKSKGKEVIGDMTVQQYKLENEELKHKCQMYEAKIKRLELVIETLRMEIDDIRHGKSCLPKIGETSTPFQKESSPKNVPQGELIDAYGLIFFTFFSMF